MPKLTRITPDGRRYPVTFYYGPILVRRADGVWIELTERERGVTPQTRRTTRGRQAR